MTQNTSVSDQDKLMAALAYPIWLIVPLIILLTESKNRPFQRYHAIQSLGISAAIFVVNIALCLVTFVVALVPFIQVLSPVLGCLSPLVFVAFVGLTLYYAYKAYQGEMFEIPFLTNFLKQQKWL